MTNDSFPGNRDTRRDSRPPNPWLKLGRLSLLAGSLPILALALWWLYTLFSGGHAPRRAITEVMLFFVIPPLAIPTIALALPAVAGILAILESLFLVIFTASEDFKSAWAVPYLIATGLILFGGVNCLIGSFKSRR